MAARAGDGPLSVRARPSSPKRDRDRRTTSTGGTCLANAHARSRLTLETTADTRARNQGPGRRLPGPDADHPPASCGQSRVQFHDPEGSSQSKGTDPSLSASLVTLSGTWV